MSLSLKKIDIFTSLMGQHGIKRYFHKSLKVLLLSFLTIFDETEVEI